MGCEQSDVAIILQALNFAAEKHRLQRRKDADKTPYINHPIAVADILTNVGGVHDAAAICAALLHDTIEDTATTEEEIRQAFGEDVLALVLECTDDKSLPKPERKRLQEINAPHKTPRAKMIKICDKISNIQDIAASPPPDWSKERRIEYLRWSERVVAGLRGVNQELEDLYDEILAKAKEVFNME